MTRLVHSFIAKADTLPPRGLLWANLALGGLVFLAHGGALLASRAHPTPGMPDVKGIALVSLPLCALLLTSAVFGLTVSRARNLVLAFHGVLLAAGAAALLVWGAGLLIYGIPKVAFSWSFGLFTVAVTYAVFVFTRYTVPASLRARPFAFYSPLFAFVVAATVDFGVMLRFAHDMSIHFAN